MMVDVKTELQDRAGVQTAAHEARDVPAMEGAAAIGQAAPVALAHPSPAPPPADAHGSDTGEGTAGAKRSYGTADLQVPDDNGNDGSTDGGAATKRPRTGSSGDGSNPDTLRVETVPPVVSWPKPARRRTHPRRRASDGRIRKLRATVDALAKPAAADAGEEANDVAALLLGLAGNPAQDAALPARVARLAAAAQELPASPPTHLCTACGRAVELRHGRRPSFLCHKAPGVAGCGRRAGTAHAVPATGGPPPGAGATPMAPWGAAFALLPVVHAADVAGPPSPTHDKSATATRDASPAARSQRRSEAEDAAHEPAGRSGEVTPRAATPPRRLPRRAAAAALRGVRGDDNDDDARDAGRDDASDNTPAPSASEASGGTTATGATGAGAAPARRHRAPGYKSELVQLCEQFRDMYGTPDAHGQLRDIYLNEAAQALGTARRRLYDIINVLSAVEVVARTGKLTYVWRGTAHLPQLMQSLVHEELHGMPAVRPTKQEPYDPYLLLPSPAESKHPSPCSLWTLARKFVRLLLARGAQQPLLLSEAAGLLSGDGAVGRRAAKSQQIITVERRLYDVCSILCTMGLVEKVQLGRRQPAYRWSFVPQGGAQPAPRGAAPSGAVPSANTGSCQFTADGARVGGGGNGAQQQAMMATLMSDPLLASLNPAALQAMVDVMMSHGNNAGTNSNGTNTHSGPPGHAHVAAPPRPAPPAPPLPSEFQAVETLLQQVIGLVPPAGPAPSGLSSGPNGAPSSAPTGSTGGLPQAPELLQQLIAVLEALAAPPRSTGPDPSLALVQALIALGSSSGIPPPSSPDEMAALFGTLPVLLQTLQSLGDGNSAGNNGAATPMPAQSQQQQSSGGLSHSMGQMPLPAWAQRPPASLPPPSSISNPSVSGQKRNSQSYGGSGNPLASSPPAPQPAQLAHFAHLAQQAQHRGGHPTQQAQHHPHAHAYHPHPPQPPKPQGAHGGANDFMQAAVQLLASQLPPGTDPAALLAAMGLPGMTSPASSAPSAHRSGQATPAMGPPASSGPPPASAPPPPPAHAPAQHTHAHRPEDDANVTALMQAMLGVFGSFAPAPRPQ